mmetsp:Transcript_69371/g.165269  ORF Transcript_69371/g.165269 Transcript_69371/m.165269 type:complete len:92 (+) Transcript_69371:2493-2768(+)
MEPLWFSGYFFIRASALCNAMASATSGDAQKSAMALATRAHKQQRPALSPLLPCAGLEPRDTAQRTSDNDVSGGLNLSSTYPFTLLQMAVG